MDSKILNSDIQKVKLWESAVYIDNDLVLLDKIDATVIPSTLCRTTFIFLALCTRGSAHYLLDTRPIDITPGDVIIISERHVVDQFWASNDIEALCMVISIPFFHEVIKNVSELSALFLYARNHPVMSFSTREQNTFREYLRVIRSKIADTDNHFRKDLVRTLILAMFYDLSNVIYRSQQNDYVHQSRAEIIFTKFIKLVEQNCRQERRVGWYAQQLCISPKYLSETIKQVSMRTPNEWIDNYVMLEIRLMLKNTSHSIKEISETLNFPNQSFMGKYFREHVGMSPSKYRKS